MLRWLHKAPALPALDTVVANLDPRIFTLTTLDCALFLPTGWRATFSLEDQRDITSTLHPIDATKRMTLTYLGVPQLVVADTRHLVPFPTTLSLLRRPRAEQESQTRHCLDLLTRYVETTR